MPDTNTNEQAKAAVEKEAKMYARSKSVEVAYKDDLLNLIKDGYIAGHSSRDEEVKALHERMAQLEDCIRQGVGTAFEMVEFHNNIIASGDACKGDLKRRGDAKKFLKNASRLLTNNGNVVTVTNALNK